MAMELYKGEVKEIAASYEIKVEEGKLKAHVETDLVALVDKAALAVPGDSAIEQIVVGLVKQSILAV